MCIVALPKGDYLEKFKVLILMIKIRSILRNPMEILEVDDVGHVNDSNPSKRSPEEIK